MTTKLQITLDEEATRKYLKWASARVTAEVDEDCEPSGCRIIIDVGGPYGSTALAQDGDDYIEFGDAKVDLVE